MSLKDGTLREEYVEDLYCPDCGHDVQPTDYYKEVAHSIGEIYFHPYCPECNHYCNAHDITCTDWYRGE